LREKGWVLCAGGRADAMRSACHMAVASVVS
jgi:hypothetical protein